MHNYACTYVCMDSICMYTEDSQLCLQSNLSLTRLVFEVPGRLYIMYSVFRTFSKLL